MTEKRKAAPALTADAVAEYLNRNPDFFVGRDDLILEMNVPHERGDAISLVERQLALLRERNIEMRHRLSHLMDVARDNDRLFDKTRRLILALLDADSLEDVVISVEDSLRQEFAVPFVGFVLFGESQAPVGRWSSLPQAQQAIGGMLDSSKPFCGNLREHELQFLFGEDAATGVASTAVVALGPQGQYGVLALGSRDSQHYKSTIGTLFLCHIAEVLSRVLPRTATPLRSVR